MDFPGNTKEVNYKELVCDVYVYMCVYMLNPFD